MKTTLLFIEAEKMIYFRAYSLALYAIKYSMHRKIGG